MKYSNNIAVLHNDMLPCVLSWTESQTLCSFCSHQGVLAQSVSLMACFEPCKQPSCFLHALWASVELSSQGIRSIFSRNHLMKALSVSTVLKVHILRQCCIYKYVSIYFVCTLFIVQSPSWLHQLQLLAISVATCASWTFQVYIYIY